MAKLWEVTKLVRSKNAGPFVLTFDIMFDDPDVYEKVRDSGALNKKLVAQMYKQNEEDVLFFNCDNALAIKFLDTQTRLLRGPGGRGLLRGAAIRSSAGYRSARAIHTAGS